MKIDANIEYLIDTKEEIEKEKESKQKQVSKLNEERSESQS